MEQQVSRTNNKSNTIDFQPTALGDLQCIIIAIIEIFYKIQRFRDIFYFVITDVMKVLQ